MFIEAFNPDIDPVDECDICGGWIYEDEADGSGVCPACEAESFCDDEE